MHNAAMSASSTVTTPWVLKKRTAELPPNSVYIGRPSKWGSPYVIGVHGTRKQVIAKYKKWVVQQPELMGSLHELTGKHLVCHCAPDACHGDVLIVLANPHLKR